MGEVGVRKAILWWWSWQMWWEYSCEAGQLNLPASFREVSQDGDGKRCCCGLPWTYPAWLYLRAQEWGAVRWGMTVRAKEIWDQWHQGGNSTVINTNTAIALPLSPDESEEIASRALRLPATSAVFCFSKIQIFWLDFSILLWEQKSYRESEASQRK